MMACPQLRRARRARPARLPELRHPPRRQSERVVERRAFDNLPAVLILLAVVVLGAGAFGFALSELTDDSGERGQRRRPPARAVGRRRLAPDRHRGRRSRAAAACCWSGRRG